MRVALNDVVSKLRPAIHRMAGPNVFVEYDLCDEQTCVLADAKDLAHALMQLCENAREAMPAGGSVVIQTRLVELLPATGDGTAQPYSRLSVADSGCGIPLAHQQRILEPSFSTKPRRPGLGLSTVNAMAMRHGGFIDFTTAVGTGTVFHVYLPVARVLEYTCKECVTDAHSR